MAQTKGRPTPKRSEREAARRKPIVQPRSGRGAVRADRSAAAERRRMQREAMRNGDERNYPAIAAGPERALVRDVVDARRPFWMLALPLWIGSVVLSIVAPKTSAALGTVTLAAVVTLLFGDLVITRRAVRNAIRAAYPNGTKEPEKVLVWYGTARNMQFRRSRLPRPRVSPGDSKA